jgi:hypothetical protein
MRSKKRITLPDAPRKQAIAALQEYFRDNLDDEIGDLKAGLLLDSSLANWGRASITRRSRTRARSSTNGSMICPQSATTTNFDRPRRKVEVRAGISFPLGRPKSPEL